MPFKSEKQRRWMHSEKPKMAKKWEKEGFLGSLYERKKKKEQEKKRRPNRTVSAVVGVKG